MSERAASNFIRDVITQDLDAGTRQTVCTRFPPEPNGYPHIGHAKSITVNFGLARAFGGTCNLRFDDTNPETEDVEFVEAFKRDVAWLGYQWDNEFYASDYFEQLYDWAVELIKMGKAYVDDLNEEEIRAYRGTVTEPGRPSPYRDRSVEENLDLFARMKAGEFPDGAKVLRAKIDMAHSNMKLRDPLMYRIRHAHHYRRGDAWCIYPMYDWAHGQSDAIEGITHSICTLEFDVNRPLYDWYLDTLGVAPRPYQYEFARLNIDYTVMSKRKLLQLVNNGQVAGWDDPRMPTISGMRRRGITPKAIRAFCESFATSKVNRSISIGVFEEAIRDDLNTRAPRVLAVLDPLKVTLTNYPDDETEWLEASYWPHDIPKEGTRQVPFTRDLLIERSDFNEDPPKGFKRLAPGRSVRLRYGYVITCDEVVRGADGQVTELRCRYHADSLGDTPAEAGKVWGVLHWVSATESLPATVRLYDRLFDAPEPDSGEGSFLNYLNPDSLVVMPDARIEPSVAGDPADQRYQFERLGYFWQDPEDSTSEALVFNRIMTLRDAWAARQAPQATKPAAEVPEAPLEQADPLESLDDAQRARYDTLIKEHGLGSEEAFTLATSPALDAYFRQILPHTGNAQPVAAWLANDFLREVKGDDYDALPFAPADVATLVQLQQNDTISSRIAKDVFAQMLETGDAPQAIIDREGLSKLDDPDALRTAVASVVDAHPDKVAQYQAGKHGLIGFFMGQLMRATRGTADPELARRLLTERLKG